MAFTWYIMCLTEHGVKVKIIRWHQACAPCVCCRRCTDLDGAYEAAAFGSRDGHCYVPPLWRRPHSTSHRVDTG